MFVQEAACPPIQLCPPTTGPQQCLSGQVADIETMEARRELQKAERKLAGLLDAVADGLRTPGLQTHLDGFGRIGLPSRIF
jgi:hypothetical protein